MLANDNDGPDVGETLTVTAVTQGGNGSVTFTATGVSYTPNANFFGADSFTYTISDGNGGSDTATVNVTVTNVNDDPVANDDTAPMPMKTGPRSINVLANDNDGPDVGETLTVDSVDTTGTLGTVTNNGTDVTYDPNGAFESLAVGETATDTFTYTVSDGNGGSDTATVTVTITGQNDNPVAVDDSADANEDGPAVAIDVLANDTDVDATDVLVVDSVDTTGTLGTVTNNGTDVTYDPNGAFESLAVGETATDTFTYTVSDGNGGSDTATVTVTITGQNDDPVAVDDSADANEDGPAVAIDVLANDTDVDATDVLVVDSVDTTGTLGTVTNNGTDVTYDPNGAFESLAVGETATDTFTYTVSDGNGGTDTATVTVTITGQNDAPVVTLSALNDLSVDEGSNHTYLFSVEDVDNGDTFTVDLADCGDFADQVGTTSVTPTGGSFVCTFPDGPETTDVTVRVEDAAGALSNTASQTVTINNVAPTVSLSGDGAANEGTSHTYDFLTDDPGEDTFAIVSVSCGAFGTQTGTTVFNPTNGAGSFVCLFPDGPASSTVSVQVEDSDEDDSNLAELEVTIANVKPTVTISSGATTANEGETKTYTYTVSDPGADTLTVVESCGANGVYASRRHRLQFHVHIP